jgi:hypothetical protein
MNRSGSIPFQATFDADIFVGKPQKRTANISALSAGYWFDSGQARCAC